MLLCAEIGIGLSAFGVLFTFLGLLFFFDRGLLALGNVRPAILDPTASCTACLVTLLLNTYSYLSKTIASELVYIILSSLPPHKVCRPICLPPSSVSGSHSSSHDLRVQVSSDYANGASSNALDKLAAYF